MTKVCLSCGALTTPGPRCPACERAWQAKRNRRPERAIYGGTWPAESRALREAEPWCHATAHAPGCRYTVDLTVDHPTRAVLSRSCHAALENSRRRASASARVDAYAPGGGMEKDQRPLRPVPAPPLPVFRTGFAIREEIV